MTTMLNLHWESSLKSSRLSDFVENIRGEYNNIIFREYTSSGRKCDVTFLLFLRKYAKIGKNNREKLGLMLKALYQSVGAISGNFE